MFPGSDSGGQIRRGNIRYFPVVPGRVEFAAEVRRVILEERPRAVAVELPEALERLLRRAVTRLPEISVIAYPEGEVLDDDDDEETARAVFVAVEPADPFIEAIRSAIEAGAEVMFLEPETGARPHLPDAYPDTYATQRIGFDRYIEAYRVHPQPRSDEAAGYARGMAWKLQGANPLASLLAVVSLNMLDPLLDAMEEPQDEPARKGFASDASLVNPHPACLAEILCESPFLQERYEKSRTAIDRRRVNFDLLKEAEKEYQRNTGESIVHWQRRAIAKYTRNLARMDGDLVAGLFDVTVAARSIVDDNYGWEVWDRANRYFAQKENTDAETVSISGDEMWNDTRRVRLRRRLPRGKQLLRPPGLKPRKKEKAAGEWAKQWNGNSICSYPPEDMVIEDYGRFLKSKAKSILSAERSRVEPFSTSMLDGIDLRETIRNWHEGKIFVRELTKLNGNVGSVVVIFDEDRQDKCQYLTTWLGEHQNESDMAYYSTNPFDHLIGPGIGRAEYGGFLMTLPPRRMFDVWSDPDYESAETKPERLLLAAIDYSTEKYVVYVAAKPPRSIFRSIAARMNRSILYVPIGQLPPAKLKKVRVVHVLDSYARRDEAKDYLW